MSTYILGIIIRNLEVLDVLQPYDPSQLDMQLENATYINKMII